MSDYMDRQIGDRVKKARLLANLTLKELSQRTGINYVTLSRIENGKRSINAVELIKIAGATKKPIPHFYEIDRVIEYFDPENHHNYE